MDSSHFDTNGAYIAVNTLRLDDLHPDRADDARVRLVAVRPREVRETKVDPDSPWAALAALKTPKS